MGFLIRRHTSPSVRIEACISKVRCGNQSFLALIECHSWYRLGVLCKIQLKTEGGRTFGFCMNHHRAVGYKGVMEVLSVTFWGKDWRYDLL
jgi:hypothetical protein